MSFSRSELVSNISLVPYSDSDSDEVFQTPLGNLLENNFDLHQDIEEETSVGKRGYKKPKSLPKRLLKKKNRRNFTKQNPCAGTKCWNNCSNKFTEIDRLTINEHFWGMDSKTRQKDWLISCIKRKCIGRKRADSNKRRFSYEYYINYKDSNTKVCQQFLLKTLNISQQMLRSTRDDTTVINVLNKTKTRRTPHNKSEESKVVLLKSFIEQLPAVPSHYCRNKSKKLYLPKDFRNLTELYERYKKYLKSTDMTSSQLSSRVFRTIFKNDFHIGFHLPKKDKCITCESRKNLENEANITTQQTEEYQKHIDDKDKSKEIFLEEQKMSKTNSSFLCVSFDMQKVLNTPHGKSVTLFYSRKYSYYNESVYESSTRNGYCFLWGEADGKRGCNEVCTILFQYLQLVDQKGTFSSISIYCDSCAGQNRNKAMLSTLQFFLTQSVFVKTIKITYLLPGHTMMPVDSIHSTIESFIRDKNVWAPSEWYTLISNARTNPHGYKCILLNYSDFKDWKSFSKAMFPASIKLNFQAMRYVVFEKGIPFITIKYGYFPDSEVKQIDLNSIARSTRITSILEKGPLNLYKHCLHISSNKYNDLKALCDKNIIHKKFHNEYLNLKHKNSIIDVLPETDEEDNTQ